MMTVITTSTCRHTSNQMKNIPIPVLTFLAVQLGGAIWWGARKRSQGKT